MFVSFEFKDCLKPVNRAFKEGVLPSLETLIIFLGNRERFPGLRFHDDILPRFIAPRIPGNIKPGADFAQIKCVTFIDTDAGARLCDDSHQQLEEMQKKGSELVFVESEIPWVWSGKAPELGRLEV